MKTHEIDSICDLLYDAGVSDALRALSRHEFADYSEAMEGHREPIAATWDDVEFSMLHTQASAKRMRATLEAKRGTWPARVLGRWESSVLQLERSWLEHAASSAHQEWLSTGGPARLWESLAARKESAKQCAQLTRDTGGDPAAFEQADGAAQWAMDEMVKLYLQEAAQ